MQTINLKKYYYPLCRQDTYLTVSDEVAEALLLMRREENNHARKVWYHRHPAVAKEMGTGNLP